MAAKPKDQYDRADDYTGDAGHDGYTCIKRAPKVPYNTGGWIDPAEAERIEKNWDEPMYPGAPLPYYGPPD